MALYQLPGVATFFYKGGKLELPRDFRTVWRTRPLKPQPRRVECGAGARSSNRIEPETRARIEAEARSLSEDLRLSQLGNGELAIAGRFADGVEVPITLSGMEDAR